MGNGIFIVIGIMLLLYGIRVYRHFKQSKLTFLDFSKLHDIIREEPLEYFGEIERYGVPGHYFKNSILSVEYYWSEETGNLVETFVIQPLTKYKEYAKFMATTENAELIQFNDSEPPQIHVAFEENNMKIFREFVEEFRAELKEQIKEYS